MQEGRHNFPPTQCTVQYSFGHSLRPLEQTEALTQIHGPCASSNASNLLCPYLNAGCVASATDSLEQIPRSAISLFSARRPSRSTSLTGTALFQRRQIPIPGKRLQSAVTSELMSSQVHTLLLSLSPASRVRLLSPQHPSSCSGFFSTLPHYFCPPSTQSCPFPRPHALSVVRPPLSTGCPHRLTAAAKHALTWTCKYEDGQTRRHNVLRQCHPPLVQTGA